MTNRLEQTCLRRGLRISEQRHVILQILDQATDHPCAEEIYRRAISVEPGISKATVYRTLRILVGAGILNQIELGDGRSHYEEAGAGHHEHLVDVETGKVLEFSDGAIAILLREAAGRLGYRLLRYRLEVFAASEATAAGFVKERSRDGDDRATPTSPSPLATPHPAVPQGGMRHFSMRQSRRPVKLRG